MHQFQGLFCQTGFFHQLKIFQLIVYDKFREIMLWKSQDWCLKGKFCKIIVRSGLK